jgi:diguanylate cyclase (GGDEF)-like protein/PAS domain S-box-containing protein
VAETSAVSRRWRVNPRSLSYLIGPAALATILVLDHFDFLAQESVWLWCALFVAIPCISYVFDLLLRQRPTNRLVQLQVVWYATAVAVVIYLTGWGPVLIGAFAFVALVAISENGSRMWRVTVCWSVVAIVIGQVAIWQKWAPSFLSVRDAEALGLMSAFILVFVIRMAGATMEQKELADTRFMALVQHSSDTTLVIGPGMVVLYASPALNTLIGRTPQDVVGRKANTIVHPDDRPVVESQIASRLRAKPVTDPIQFRLEHKDGSWRYVEAVVSDLRDNPSVAGYVANVRDITERKLAEDLLAHQALHDPLTGLPNRTLILDRAEQMIARARREHEPVAALFIDLDDFKNVNDTFGHKTGDAILREVANRLSSALRASDTVGRLGGDEFVVLVEGTSSASRPEFMAGRLQLVLREPFRIPGFEGTVTLSASVGVATGDRESAQNLLRDADVALYQAKSLGKDGCVTFEPGMQAVVAGRLELEMELHSALDNRQFYLVYQPIIDLEDLTPCGVEALLRWHHPTRLVVMPDEFIPLLEESGLILEVGRWVLSEACRQAAAWHRKGMSLTVSVNTSIRQLEADIFVTDVRQALTESGLLPHLLVIELTETAIMRDPESVVHRLRALKQLGVQIAVDDFGTGYSSLAYLQEFPIDSLKIDRSFVAALTHSSESSALIHTLVELGRAIGLETIAEGIEDESQLYKLQDELCNRGQGYLFSRPMAPAAVETYVREHAVRPVPQRRRRLITPH